MCEYALRKHSESTGRVPRRLCPSMYIYAYSYAYTISMGGGRRLAGRNAKRERAAREGARRLWFAWYGRETFS
jgi:hypothetical protein